jgi:hypothetical protein
MSNGHNVILPPKVIAPYMCPADLGQGTHRYTALAQGLNFQALSASFDRNGN